jgi:hypothetical protein
MVVVLVVESVAAEPAFRRRVERVSGVYEKYARE